jgi:hypothetical protein
LFFDGKYGIGMKSDSSIFKDILKFEARCPRNFAPPYHFAPQGGEIPRNIALPGGEFPRKFAPFRKFAPL